MATVMVDTNRRAFEEKVDSGIRDLNEGLATLAESLGNYGFSGNVKLQLVVSLDDDVHGQGYAVIDRATSLKFRR